MLFKEMLSRWIERMFLQFAALPSGRLLVRQARARSRDDRQDVGAALGFAPL
jgi:hypothetical protein